MTRTKARSSNITSTTAPRPSATSYVWRRLHGGRLIAQVSRLQGIGSWLVTAYSARNDAKLVRSARSFSMLTDAQRAADNLVHDSFEHDCRTGECGRWLRWPEPVEE